MRRFRVLCATCCTSSRRSSIGSGGTPSISCARHTNPAPERGAPDEPAPDPVHERRERHQDHGQGAEGGDLQRRGVLELDGDGRSEGGGRREQRRREERVQADDHGDGDGLAERPRGRERHGADDAGPGAGQHDLAQHLPLRRTDAEGALELVVGHDGDGVSRQGHDHRQDHDEEHAAGQAAARRPRTGAWKGKWLPVMSASLGCDDALEPRGEHEQAPEPVDDARDSRQELDERGGEDPSPRRQARARWRAPMPSPIGIAKTRAMAVVASVPGDDREGAERVGPLAPGPCRR